MRTDRRVTVELQAEIILDIDSLECTTADLSAGGVKLNFADGLFKNIRINIADSGEISGEIIWVDSDAMGIKFHEDQGEIIKVLARVTS